MPNEEHNSPQPIVSRVPMRVAQPSELNAYVVYEHESDSIEGLDDELTKDPPESVYLNLALFLFPISISFLITLLTTVIHANRIYELFVIVSLLAFVVSLILFALWVRDRRSYRKMRQSLLNARKEQIQRIKQRMPPNPPVQVAHIIAEEE